MKLRFDQNHIIFRMSPEQWDHLLATGAVNGQTLLPGTAVLHYGVETRKSGEDFSLHHQDGLFILKVRQDLLETQKNTASSREGLVYKTPLDNGSILKISLQVDIKKSQKI